MTRILKAQYQEVDGPGMPDCAFFSRIFSFSQTGTSYTFNKILEQGSSIKIPSLLEIED